MFCLPFWCNANIKKMFWYFIIDVWFSYSFIILFFLELNREEKRKSKNIIIAGKTLSIMTNKYKSIYKMILNKFILNWMKTLRQNGYCGNLSPPFEIIYLSSSSAFLLKILSLNIFFVWAHPANIPYCPGYCHILGCIICDVCIT